MSSNRGQLILPWQNELLKLQPPLGTGARKAPGSSAPHQRYPLVLCHIHAPLRGNPQAPSVSFTRMVCYWFSSSPLGRRTQRLLFNWDYAFWNSSRNFNGLIDVGGELYFLSGSAIQQGATFSEPVSDSEFRLLYVLLLLFECSVSLQAILSSKGKALFIISTVNIKSWLSSFSSSTQYK